MIAALAASLLAVVGFALALWVSGIVAAAERALDRGMSGLMAMLDPELGDDVKEVAVRRAGFGLIASSFGILWRLAATVAAAAAPVLVGDAFGLVSGDQVLELMLRWDWILVVFVLSVVVGLVLRRRPRPDTTSSTRSGTRYSRADRMLHAAAFSSPRVLRTAARLETRFAASPHHEVAPPIFITSLARAGTTALLNALHDVPGIATHTYRDMPLLTAPTLWNRLAGGRLRHVERHERAHGDGLEIDLDTPEAFEEVIWKLCWPEKYQGPTIQPWRASADWNDEGNRFLSDHMRTVIHARARQGRPDALRYCSKNNTNIARLEYLPRAFPGCRIVVPVRRPESHAASLLRQHHNFSRLQAEDDFVGRYMRDIGHFEFGLIHKPIEFPGFDPERHDPATPDYWLDYWIHAFRYVLQHGADCVFLTQDDLRTAPEQAMAAVCDELGLRGAPTSFAPHFHERPDEAPTNRFDPQLYQEAAGIYDELHALALSPRVPVITA